MLENTELALALLTLVLFSIIVYLYLKRSKVNKTTKLKLSVDNTDDEKNCKDRCVSVNVQNTCMVQCSQIGYSNDECTKRCTGAQSRCVQACDSEETDVIKKKGGIDQNYEDCNDECNDGLATCSNDCANFPANYPNGCGATCSDDLNQCLSTCANNPSPTAMKRRSRLNKK